MRKGLIPLYLKPDKLYFSCDDMAQFSFGQNWLIWVKNTFLIQWDDLDKFNGYQTNEILYSEIAWFLNQAEL